MDHNHRSYTVKDLLRTEVAPALGCTEPIAIALATAAAASLMPADTVERVEIWVDPNIYKNGVAVAIPGTQGNTGLDLAAAIGALGGDPMRRLEVLEPITEDIVTAAKGLVHSGRVTVNLLQDQKGLFIQGKVAGNGKTAVCIIRDYHDNIVELTLNDTAVKDSPLLRPDDRRKSKIDPRELEAWLKQLSLGDLLHLVDHMDDEDLAFIHEGVQYNSRLAEHGLKFGSGLGIGKTLERLVRQKLIKKDMILAARILTSAASDARMQGVKLPAMSSAGSGNHGLTAVLPIWAVKEYVDCDEKSVLEAICLSHIITAYVKAHTGRLTAICGCSVAAGAGATAGITYLLGGDQKHIAGAIMNLTEDLAGVICDGAKAGCSLKLATAAGTAVQSALFALQGVHVQATDGIISASPETTMKNIGELSVQGMVEADRTILKIMLEKQFGDVS